jgi:hypothetical protein
MKRHSVNNDSLSSSSSSQHSSMAVSHIKSEVLTEIEGFLDTNRKLDDIHVMTFLTIQKAFALDRGSVDCDIRIIDSLQISLFMSKSSPGQRQYKEEYGNGGGSSDDKEDDGKPRKRVKVNDGKAKASLSDAERHYYKLLSYFSKTEKGDDNYMVIIPLNGDGHWSLLVYCAFIKNWFSVDSIKDYHIPTTKAFFTRFFNFNSHETKKHGFATTKIVEIGDFRDQLSDWECGQFLIVNAGLFIRYVDDLKKGVVESLISRIADVSETPGRRLTILKNLLGLFIKTL